MPKRYDHELVFGFQTNTGDKEGRFLVFDAPQRRVVRFAGDEQNARKLVRSMSQEKRR